MAANTMDYKVVVTKEQLLRLWKKFLASPKVKKTYLGNPSDRINGHVYRLQHKEVARVLMDVHVTPREVYTITLQRNRAKDTFFLTKVECDKLVALWDERPGELEMTVKEVESLL